MDILYICRINKHKDKMDTFRENNKIYRRSNEQMIKTYKYKLYNSDKNHALHDSINIACHVYNHSLSLHKRYYRLYKKTLNTNKLQKHLSKLRKSDKYKHWKKLNSQTIQDVTQRIERSYKQFFSNLKKHRPPKYKSRDHYKSITFKQCGFKLLENNKIKIGGKIYKYWKSRDFQGIVKRFLVKRDSLRDFYIYFFVEEDIKPKAFKTGKIAGCDFGLKTFLTTSDNEKIESPLCFLNNLNKLREKSKQLSKKKNGSKNRIKARRSLARLHRKIENQRNDFHFKLANMLTKEYDVLFFEDLNLDGMKKLWGRKVSDLAFDSFLRKLEWKMLESKKEVKYIDRWFPSSKLCSRESCGILNENLKLEDRTWTCACGKVHDRDLNAAINILKAGASAYEGDMTSKIFSNENFKLCC